MAGKKVYLIIMTLCFVLVALVLAFSLPVKVKKQTGNGEGSMKKKIAAEDAISGDDRKVTPGHTPQSIEGERATFSLG